jgi:hypothetical protein
MDQELVEQVRAAIKCGTIVLKNASTVSLMPLRQSPVETAKDEAFYHPL